MGKVIIRAYHGTDNAFSPDEIFTNAYLTDNPEIAVTFGKNVMHLEVCSENPYKIDWRGCSWGGGYIPADSSLFEEFVRYASDGDEDEASYWRENGMCVNMLADLLAGKGHDLLIVHNVLEEDHGFCKTEYVALPGCIIKGVTDNKEGKQ